MDVYCVFFCLWGNFRHISDKNRWSVADIKHSFKWGYRNSSHFKHLSLQSLFPRLYQAPIMKNSVKRPNSIWNSKLKQSFIHFRGTTVVVFFFFSLSLLLDSFRSLQAKATKTKRNNCAKPEPENAADRPERVFFCVIFLKKIEFKENRHVLYLCTEIILITGAEVDISINFSLAAAAEANIIKSRVNMETTGNGFDLMWSDRQL